MTQPSPSLLEKLLPQVVALAIKAGGAIMHVYKQPLGSVTSKSDNSPLTEADLVSHQIICAGLADLLPHCPTLSEEAANIPFETRNNWTQFWLVDPLDGTKEFIKRNGEFTVNIALIDNGEPILGVVYAPVLGVCYYAARGVGAFVQRGLDDNSNGGDTVPASNAHPVCAKSHSAAEAVKVVASRSHSDARTEALLKQLGDYECISMGSSLKLCLVAEGTAHFYPRLGPTMEWDTAAAQAVVNEAGAVVCDIFGKELRYNKADLHNPEFFVYAKSDTTLSQILKSLS